MHLLDVARHVVCVVMHLNFQLLGAHKRKWLGIICTLIDRESLLSSIHSCDCNLSFDVLVVYEFVDVEPLFALILLYL